MKNAFLVETLTVALLCSLIAGCGGFDVGDDGTYPDVADEELYATVLVDAYCEAAWQCSTDRRELADSARLFWGRFGSLERCKANAHIPEAEFSGMLHGIEFSAQEERVIIDRAYTTACKDDLRDRICANEEPSQTPSSCLQLLNGQVDEEEPCLSVVDCSGELTCRRPPDSGECFGQCLPRESDDETCGGDICEADEFCEKDWANLSESCVALKEENHQCDAHKECESDLACSDFIEECVPFEVSGPGGACTYGETFCTPGYRCIPSQSGLEITDLSGSCAVLGNPGDPCIDTRDCRSGQHCRLDTQHEVTTEEEAHQIGECTVLPLGIGEDCSTDSQCGSANCQEGSCRNPDGTVLLENGEPCTSTSQCASGYCRYSEDRQEPICKAEPEPQICELPE